MYQSASYACHPSSSRGRFYNEACDPQRSPFQRDRDRILHARSFRRLKQKTQVFISTQGDHYRTRLTHSLEVAQIGRSLARDLRLDEDLVEALCLAHDLGHTPFGHAGERALALKMADFGAFDHNAQSLRIVSQLEGDYPQFQGLNLSWETLEGLVKHNGPLLGVGEGIEKINPHFRLFEPLSELDLTCYASLEAQVAALSDDIAYNTHDLDDGLRAGMFDLDALEDVRVVRDVMSAIRSDYPSILPHQLIFELKRRLVSLFIRDVFEETLRRIHDARIVHVDDVRQAGFSLVAFSAQGHEHVKELQTFLRENMYFTPSVQRIMENAASIVSDLFDLYVQDVSLLPNMWGQMWRNAGYAAGPRVVADFVSGMTDPYAIQQHKSHFHYTPSLV